METEWIEDRDGCRYALYVPPVHITVGIAVLDGVGKVASLGLAYELATLSMFSRFFNLVIDGGRTAVYLWEEKLNARRVSVTFSLPYPEERLIEALIVKEKWKATQAKLRLRPCTEMIVRSDAALSAKAEQMFLAQFAIDRVGLAAVHEHGMEVNDPSSFGIGFHEVFNREPRLLP